MDLHIPEGIADPNKRHRQELEAEVRLEVPPEDLPDLLERSVRREVPKARLALPLRRQASLEARFLKVLLGLASDVGPLRKGHLVPRVRAEGCVVDHAAFRLLHGNLLSSVQNRGVELEVDSATRSRLLGIEFHRVLE